MATDEEMIRFALAEASARLPGAPSLPSQVAPWLVEAVLPLLKQARERERRQCVQELLDQARWCRVNNVPRRAVEYEHGALWLRDPETARKAEP